MASKFKFTEHTASEWASLTPAKNEYCIATETKTTLYKIGNGSYTYANLPFRSFEELENIGITLPNLPKREVVERAKDLLATVNTRELKDMPGVDTGTNLYSGDLLQWDYTTQKFKNVHPNDLTLNGYVYLGEATVDTVPVAEALLYDEYHRLYYTFNAPVGITTLPNFGIVGAPISTSYPRRYYIMWNGTTWSAVADTKISLLGNLETFNATLYTPPETGYHTLLTAIIAAQAFDNDLAKDNATITFEVSDGVWETWQIQDGLTYGGTSGWVKILSSWDLKVLGTLGTGGGTAQVQTITYSDYGISGYISGIKYSFIPTLSNTATAPTININGWGALTVKNGDNASISEALVANDILQGVICNVVYDGTDLRLLNPQATVKNFINSKMITAGDGLTGGGDFSSNRAIAVGATDDSVVIGADGIKVNTVDSLVSTSTTRPLSAKQGKALQDAKVNTSDIVDTLVSTSTTVPLSAKQGKVLNEAKINISDIVDTLVSTSTVFPLSAKQGKTLQDSKVNTSDIVDTLISTSTTVPLSANQGKVINDKIILLNTLGTGGGTAQAQTITYTQEITLAVGQEFSYIPTASNTATAPTVAITANGIALGAKTVLLGSGAGVSTALRVNDILIGRVCKLKWDGTNLLLMNPQSSLASNLSVTPTGGIVSTNVQAALAELDTEGTAQDAAILSAVPLVPYIKRVEGISGATISSKEDTKFIFDEMQDLLPYTDLLVCPQAGLKVESGKVSALYDFKNAKDATQATDANRPYIVGNIAPNEKRAIKNMNTSTEVSLAHTAIIKANTASWSVVTTLNYTGKRNNPTDSGVYCGGAGGSFFYIDRNNSGNITIYSVSGTLESVSASGAFKPYIGKNVTVIWTYNNGSVRCYVNGLNIPVSQNLLGLNISQLANGYITRQFAGNIYYHQILSKELSASEVQNISTILSAQYPEIEGVNIGNQHWQTSNYEGVITANGTVIPEVTGATTAGNPELIINGGFDTDVSSWITSRCSITWNNLQYAELIQNTGSNRDFAIYPQVNIGVVGKSYIVSFIAKSPNTNEKPTIKDTHFSNIIAINNPNLTSDWQTYTYIGTALRADLAIYLVTSSVVNGTQVDIDNISIKEVGWADLTTPAWCYYNNDPALGAIYGKLYNHYAVDAIAANPPAGWRVPTKADFTQLIAYLGGSAIAGGKAKVQGLDYWGTPNSGATNESGLSIIGSGYRNALGLFSYLKSFGFIQTSNETSSTYYGYYNKSTTTLFAEASDAIQSKAVAGIPIRLIRTSPVGSDVQKLTTGVFTTDITSTYKLLNIPFGYAVSTIKVKCDSNVTNFECKMYDYAGTTLQSTLVTGKSATAGVPIKFGVVADSPIQYNDPQLRFTCTKAVSTANLEIGVVIEKIL